MKATEKLPNGYKEIFSVDMQNNKKTALLINGIGFIIMAAMIVPALFLAPRSFSFDGAELTSTMIKLVVIAVSTIVYLILHELVHGITMKCMGTKKVKYGFTGLYAFAGSDDYYGKSAYITIALAPIVVWGIVLAILNFIVPQGWFWVVYIIQIMNISGAAGDLYVTFKFMNMPKDILVSDSGTSMTVYSASSKEAK